MRLLDLADKALRVYLNDDGENQMKLVIIYPRETCYTDRIRTALADILRPEEEPAHSDKEGAYV